jgi:PAT family beta-lactamase induction signal transducer AmpG
MQHDGEKTSYLAHLSADRRFAAMLGLGFSSGIPYLLVYATQSAWLSEAKVPIETIGLLSEMTIAYKFKWLWAPFLDRYDAPIFGALLGRRRGWIVVSQLLVMLALAGVAFGDPASWLAWSIAFSLALGVAGATQDIVIDGWRITSVAREKQSVMTAFAEAGYRVGVLCAGAGALLLADRFGWRAAYLAMAALMTPGMIAALVAPEPEGAFHASHHQHFSFATTVVAPIKELATRLGPIAIPILIMVAGFRMPGYISNAMAIPLFKHLQYSDSEIATVTKVFGFGVALAGVVFSSWIVRRIGLMKGMLLGTITGSASHLSLAYLAAHGGDFWTFALAVSVDNFAASYATIVLITFMSSLTSSELAASQFALLTSLCALPGSLLAGASGYFVGMLGYEKYFVATSLIGIPVAMLCLWVSRRHSPQLSA